MEKPGLVLCGVGVLFLILQASAQRVQDPAIDQTDNSTGIALPAIAPLLNFLLPSINTIYNLILASLSALDNLPQELSSSLPIDLDVLKSSLLNLYIQALELIKFLVNLPRDDDTEPGDNDVYRAESPIHPLINNILGIVKELGTNVLDNVLVDAILFLVRDTLGAVLSLLH